MHTGRSVQQLGGRRLPKKSRERNLGKAWQPGIQVALLPPQHLAARDPILQQAAHTLL